MVWLAVAVVLLAAALIGVIVAYAHELRRFEAFLHNRPLSSSTQLCVGAPLPGCTGLASAINAQLYASSCRELRTRQDEEGLLEGLAGLSHDIRTPLAGAKGYIQLARAEEDGIERGECLAMAEQRLDAMQALLDQLFEYTRTLVPADPPAFETVDAMAVLSSVLAGRYPEFAEKGWEVRVDSDRETLEVESDEGMLRRLMENIVSNMLKHGDGGSRVSVVGNAMTFSNALRTGDAVDADRVFERFYRGDGSRTRPGAGLGLPVVRSLCETLGMKAEASVEDGRFSLALYFSASGPPKGTG